MKRHHGSLQHILHFEGLVFLAQNQPAPEICAEPPVWDDRPALNAAEIYQLFFHGPSFQVLDSAQLSTEAMLGKFNKQLAHSQETGVGLADTSLLIELCFQTAGLWEAGVNGVLALPQSVGSLKVYPQLIHGVSIFAEVKPREVDGKVVFDARVVDEKGHVFLELGDYRTVPLPYPAEPGAVEPLKKLVENARG